MQLSFLGACREVGRAGVLAEENETRVLLDYGIGINGEIKTPLPVQGFVDGVIVSHAHLDHSGYCPALYEGTEVPCYMTPVTVPLIDFLVKDSIKVQQMRGLKQIFTRSHLKRMLRCIIPVEYEREKKIGDFNFKLHDAGHIAGAAYVHLESKNNSLIYTGDINFENSLLHEAASVKYDNVDFLITESTYGGREHPDRKETEKEFVAACREVCDENGNVLAPSFALGRAQEIASILFKHDFEYPVYLDGMAKQATEIMLEFPHLYRNYKEFYAAMKKVHWVSNRKGRENALDDPSVIISTAGMLQGGPAVSYLLNMLSLPNQAVFFVGFQPEGTPGKHLLETGKFKYEGYNVDCEGLRMRHFDFSAHASSSELVKCAEELNPKAVFVVHGDLEQANTLAERIREKIGCQAIVPKLGEKFDTDGFL